MQTLHLLVLTSSALLFGCASSPTELVASTPDLADTSDKPADLVARCIDTKWEATKAFGGNNIVELKTVEGGIRVSQRFGNNLHFLAVVSARGNGSRSQVWKQKVLAVGRIPQLNDVASCQ